MAKLRFGAGPKVVGISPATDFSLSFIEQPTGVPAGTVIVAEADANVATATGAGVANNYRIIVADSFLRPGYAFESLDTAVCSVDADGVVSRVADGLGRINVVTPVGTRRVSRLHTFSSYAYRSLDSWAAGSLARHIHDAISAMTADKTPSAATQNMFSVAGGGTAAPSYTRNASLFSGALDLTAISCVTDTTGSDMFPVVLISPRHVMAGHVGCPVGGKVVFKDSAGNYQTRTVLSQSGTGLGGSYVGLLDSPVTTVPPMSILPATWADYLPSLSAGKFTLPVLNKGWTAGDKLRVQVATRVGADGDMSLRPAYYASEGFLGWATPIIGGDSNGPVFVPVNGAPALLHCMHFSSGGEFYPSMLTAIDAAMTALGGGYVSTKTDLSGFASYA